MTPYERELLGRYNEEKSRGLVHTEEWARYMAVLQERFEDDMRAQDAARQRSAELALVLPWWRRWMVRGRSDDARWIERQWEMAGGAKRHVDTSRIAYERVRPPGPALFAVLAVVMVSAMVYAFVNVLFAL